MYGRAANVGTRRGASTATFKRVQTKKASANIAEAFLRRRLPTLPLSQYHRRDKV